MNPLPSFSNQKCNRWLYHNFQAFLFEMRMRSRQTLKWKNVCRFSRSPEKQLLTLWNLLDIQSVFLLPAELHHFPIRRARKVRKTPLIWLKACKTFVLFDDNTLTHTQGLLGLLSLANHAGHKLSPTSAATPLTAS